MKKGILMTLFGAFVFIYHLVLMIQSFYYENDGYGKTLEMDQDLVIKSIASLVLLVCGIVVLIKLKKKQDTSTTYHVSLVVVGLLMSIYPLGMMFKAINKHKSGSVIVDYLLWAICGAFILAFGIISAYEKKEKLV